jgi:polyphosphate kinase
VFYFQNGGEPELYFASADWMERNFFRRVEVGFPILRESQRERILRDLQLYLADNTQAWLLRPDGSYVRAEAGTDPPVSAQKQLLENYAAGPGTLV